MAKRKRLGEILLEAKVVDEGQLQAALQRHWSTGRRLGDILKDMGMVTERDIAVALARQFGIKTVSNIAKASFSAELLALFDGETAIDKMLFPLKVEDKTLYLAMVNPLDMETIDNLSFKLGMRIVPCVTTPTEIQAAVNSHYFNIVIEQSHESDVWWTVLVVDDQNLVRSEILAALKEEGYNLLEASNGSDGLKMAIEEKPHLILADTVMPQMSGHEMYQAIQGNLNIKHIPVIALSSKSSPEEEAKLLDMGYFDLIAKPVNPVRLVARTKHALRIIYGSSPPPR
ncbi:MAG: response regulator [Desulfuromonadales bacterium]|jgi:CheY-like chemotaxis protein